MVDISREAYEISGIETAEDNDGILQVNEKRIEERLDQKTLQEITTKYYSDHRKHRHDLLEEQKIQSNRIFVDSKLVVKVTMDCRTTLLINLEQN